MALTINTEITGQQATAICTYCYLYEPLRISITESNTLGEFLYVDLEIIDTTNSASILDTQVAYGLYDINPGAPLSIDLMKLARQYHDSNLYQYSSIADITDTATGWHSVVSKYKYNFKIYTDVTTTPTQILKLPIIGGRPLYGFVAAVDNTQDLTEASLLGVDLADRFNAYPIITQTLADPTAVDSKPTITSSIEAGGCTVEGYVIYKSRYGGWMTWGFDIQTKNFNGMYSGSLEVGMFESTDISGGSPYVPVDYTEVMSSYSIQLKALSLLDLELQAVSGVHSTPAIYYFLDSSNLELMKKTSASTPVSSLASGGDFTLSLGSISTTNQYTR
jgi:hypothetical protein